MSNSVKASQIISDIETIQAEFAHDNSRMVRGEVTARINALPIVTSEVREVATDAVRKLYEGVVWEDDIRGRDVTLQLEVEKIRLLKKL